ncbi:PepSY domain-containing protein [Stigmatella sp. ncwal1]|uniref:PepSY domain-containing protein n=1 Tax=Stigmatella ashevillensis TaxID=2995309 RepID=A0ABT5DAC3_9BACT|nr:PepSY domain-containing protein [Stigmatella ashevillena]MDC0709292.1 PepSY domain-containing protein [Stigmatella ashevillena]
MSRLHNAFATVALLAGFAGGTALASDADEIKMLAQTKITLQQAIELAQQHQGGQAFEASIDDDSFKPVYEVSVVKDNRVYDVWVDGVEGKVLGAREDRKKD